MSKLSGMQIFELLSDVNDSLITESISPILTTAAGTTAGAAAKSTVDPSTLYRIPAPNAPSVHAGFVGWLAKGGWVALVAGAVAAVGIAVGMFTLQDNRDLPPVESGAPNGETVTGELESATMEVETEETETNPPPVIEDFSNDSILSLFSAEQGTLSVSEDGALVLDALWEEGAENRSSLIFDPQKVMNALDGEADGVPGAVVIKAKRVQAMPETPTVSLGTETFGRLDDISVSTYRHAYAASTYEYFVLDTKQAASLQNGTTPLLHLEWVCMGDRKFSSEGRSLTVREISFHNSIWDAFLAVRQDMEEGGVALPEPNYWYGDNQVLFDSTPVRVSFFYVDPKGPNGEVIDHVSGEAFTKTDAMTVAIFGEGFDWIANRCLLDNKNLQAVYLPDSLTALKGDPFAFCPKLTRIRIGSGIQLIEDGAIPFAYVTDIDYNGTMAEWCQVDRESGQGSGRTTVHCLDGDINYAATQPDTEQTDAATNTLAWNMPMNLAAGQGVIEIQATRLTLTNKAGGAMEVVLRWALTRRVGHPTDGYDGHYLYYFDVISPADGSILYALDHEESLAFARDEGSSIAMAQGSLGGNLPQTATLFFTNYGYGEAGDTFRVRVTHFRLELTEEGTFTVNRNVSEKLNEDVTVPYPVEGHSDLNKTRQVFRDIDNYMADTYGLSNLKPAHLLLVTRPHGDSAIFDLRLAPRFDGFLFSDIQQFLDPSGFNFQTLEYLYHRFGAYKKLD